MPVNQQEIQRFGHPRTVCQAGSGGFITGLHKVRFMVSPWNSAEHRLYNTGESTRHIDWKLSAVPKSSSSNATKKKPTCVVSWSSTILPRCTFRNPGNRKSRTRSISVHAAAALAYLLRMQRDAVGLSVFSDTMEMNTPPRSSSVHHKLYSPNSKTCYVIRVLSLRRKRSRHPRCTRSRETIHRRSPSSSSAI